RRGWHSRSASGGPPGRGPRSRACRGSSRAPPRRRRRSGRSRGSPRSCARAREDLLNDLALGVGVVLDVPPAPRRELAFRARVEVTVVGMRAEPVAEAEGALELLALGVVDVQVHRRVVAAPHAVLAPLPRPPPGAFAARPQ